jgi:cytochrome c oxidase subunit 3
MNEAHHHRDDAGSKLGMWLFLFSELILFGGLFLLYAVYLDRYPKEFAAGGQGMDLILGTANTMILITSSFAAAMAMTAIQRNRPRLTLLLLGATVTCAAVFLFNKYLEWSDKIHHGVYPNSSQMAAGPPGESVFFSLYYLTTGLHGLHVLVGASLLTWVAIRVKRKKVHSGDYILLENCVLYWHLVDMIWIFIFPFYYLLL